jgi:carbon storage regulator
MLVLSRKIGESIKLSEDIEITVLAVDNGRVRLGIRAPRHINVRRSSPEINIDEANREAAIADEPAATGLLRKAALKKKEA